MPAKNSVKQYLENRIYHVYNRGVEKRIIFQDEGDYIFFMSLLKDYLSKPEKDDVRSDLTQEQITKKTRRERKNFHSRITLLSFCLMPNHFHLLVKQTDCNDLSEFMRCLITAYSIYFNYKYDRIGSLFQGRYKGIHVTDDNYLLHLSRYIHLNPLELLGGNIKNLKDYDFSSYHDYLKLKNTKWVNTKPILDYFLENKKFEIISSRSYQSFVEEYKHSSAEMLGNLTLD